MKKIFAMILVAVLACGIMCGCAGKSDEGDVASNDYTEIAGIYTMEADGSTITIGEDGAVDVNIVRLAEFEGTASGISKGIVVITVTDPNGGEMGMEFTPEDKTLVVTDSSWDLLPSGDSFVFDKFEAK